MKYIEKSSERAPIVVELFAGAGGLGLGFKDAGYSVVVANDLSEDACATLALNDGGMQVIQGDISQEATRDAVTMALGDRVCHVVIGGAPCQPHSLAGYRRDDDPRGFLVFDFADMVERLDPMAFVLENVLGLRTKEQSGRHIYGELMSRFDALGYTTRTLELDAKNFGAPQTRKRLFIVGSRDNTQWVDPMPSHTEDGREGTQAWVTVDQAIGDLTDHPDDQTLSHVRPRHGKRSVELIRATKPGDGVYGQVRKINRRLRGDRPAWTVMAANRGKFTHHVEDRLITGREAARLQGFEDSYLFCGTQSSVREQIGNAVPPPLAKAVAMVIRPALDAMIHLETEKRVIEFPLASSFEEQEVA